MKLDGRKFGSGVFWAVFVICALLVAADLFYTKGGHYPMERVLGFHGAYGFVSCVALVIAAKQLRRLLKRDEDFYD